MFQDPPEPKELLRHYYHDRPLRKAAGRYGASTTWIAVFDFLSNAGRWAFARGEGSGSCCSRCRAGP